MVNNNKSQDTGNLKDPNIKLYDIYETLRDIGKLFFFISY